MPRARFGAVQVRLSTALVLAAVGMVAVSAVPRRRGAPVDHDGTPPGHAFERPASPTGAGPSAPSHGAPAPEGRNPDRPFHPPPTSTGWEAAPGESLHIHAAGPSRAPNPGVLVVEPIRPEREPLRPMPTRAELFRELGASHDEERIALGQRLFEGTALSADASTSCLDCHLPPVGGIAPVVHVDRTRRRLRGRSTADVLEEQLPLHVFWTDRARAFDELHGSDSVRGEFLWGRWEASLERLIDDGFGLAFASVFHDVERARDLDPWHVISAIDDYLRVAAPPESAFDRYLRGDPEAIGPHAREGYQLFKNLGCGECHDGVSGGGQVRRLGTARSYFDDRGPLGVENLGRYAVTGEREERFTFEVPPLRDVARRAPYFHDRSQPSLRHAVLVMARHQLDIELAEWEVERIVAFLHSLSDARPHEGMEGR